MHPAHRRKIIQCLALRDRQTRERFGAVEPLERNQGGAALQVYGLERRQRLHRCQALERGQLAHLPQRDRGQGAGLAQERQVITLNALERDGFERLKARQRRRPGWILAMGQAHGEGHGRDRVTRRSGQRRRLWGIQQDMRQSPARPGSVRRPGVLEQFTQRIGCARVQGGRIHTFQDRVIQGG